MTALWVYLRHWKAYELRTRLASEEINLHAFSAVPLGSNVGRTNVALSSRGTHIELTIFPDRFEKLLGVAEELGRTLIGRNMRA